VAFVGLTAWWLPQVPGIKRGAPWQASAELDALPGHARVLNQYALGGWLLWTAPDTSPILDGRTEIYSPEHVGQTNNAIALGRGWQQFVSDSHVDAAWLPKNAPLRFGLETLGWRQTFHDSFTVILVPPASAR
jgi:hypothetical protein